MFIRRRSLALRENDQVAVRAADSRLAIRSVDVVHRRAADALIRGNFLPDDELVVSRLTNAIPGMLLQTAEEADRQRTLGEPGDNEETQRVSDRGAALRAADQEESAISPIKADEPEKSGNNATGSATGQG